MPWEYLGQSVTTLPLVFQEATATDRCILVFAFLLLVDPLCEYTTYKSSAMIASSRTHSFIPDLVGFIGIYCFNLSRSLYLIIANQEIMRHLVWITEGSPTKATAPHPPGSLREERLETSRVAPRPRVVDLPYHDAARNSICFINRLDPWRQVVPVQPGRSICFVVTDALVSFVKICSVILASLLIHILVGVD